ncbi:glycosyltransferase [Pseudochrobactrum sp. Wa41.01b-1]|uniref:glycosyltransferase family 2 protein n=1 Tax=Pseudochrobactrum sp. Wa41.01b-1 TaxID=2864102 RepID=UPI001C6932F7|nr:glycosyltransferase family 2 protein [Pseudochrobactrum sp. Wa41.01b-1]QYM73339.1 glycosyltransferase [Pseudochrobactrum sp. Wa41.01b-1]
MSSNGDMTVTIIMPAHNSMTTINRAISSVVEQSYPDWKLLIIDDLSKDKTVQIVESWCERDARIQLIELSTWSGVAVARNTGLNLVSSGYVAFLDSDDFWSSDKLQIQIDFIKKIKTPITFSSYYRVDENEEIIGSISAPNKISYLDLLKSNFIGNSTAVFKWSCFQDIRFKSVGNEDHMFWLECLRKVNGYVFSTPCETPLAYYLVRPDSLSGNKFKSLSYEWIIYRRELKFNYIKSVYYILNYIYYGIMKRR